jgi:peptidoglycan/xylan/chitin deacetylase (PgdA/CDA1 family)
MRLVRIKIALGAVWAASALLSGCQLPAAASRPVFAHAHFSAQGVHRPVSAPPAASSETATASSLSTESAESSLTSSPPSSPASPAVAPLPAPIAALPELRPAKTLSRPRDLGVPILMYHVIGEAPHGAANPDLYVTPKEFVKQLTYLSKRGYHAVTLRQVYDFWHGKRTLPSNPIVISFDDGDTPDFTIAAPLLNELHWPGTLNLIVGKKKPRLKPKIVRALIAAGWEIDSHTMTHQDVSGLSASQLRYEIAESRKQLRKRYHVPVDFFCYPTGRYDDDAIAAVKAAGYLGATSTHGGLARPSDMWTLRRVRVSGGHSTASFAALLAAAD